MKTALEFRAKSFTFLSLAATSVVFASCSVPTNFTNTVTKEKNLCACEDGSQKLGKRWEKCGEIVEEKIGRQGYYGELEKTKRTAYFSLDCKAE